MNTPTPARELPGTGNAVPAVERLLSSTSTVAGDRITIAVAGEIDMLTAPLVLDAIHRAVPRAGPRDVILDLTAVTFLGCHGITVLLTALELLGPDRFRITVGGNHRILRLAWIFHVAEILPLGDGAAEAASKSSTSMS